MTERKRYSLKAVAAETEAEHPPIEIETEDGQVFEIPPPQLWPDAAIDPATGPLATAVAVMGVEQFARFKQAGGTVALLNLVIAQYAEDEGLDAGKSSAS